MDDEAAILSAIAGHPAEDTPRLAYADWLDDHAAYLPDPAAARVRAEFIRLQCEIKKYDHLPSSQQQGYADLYRRQDAILTGHRRDLLGPLGDELGEHEVVFDRGFAVEVRLDADQFVRHADAIAAMKPLPDVSVTAPRVRRALFDSPHLGLITDFWLQSTATGDDWLRPIDTVRPPVWSLLRKLSLNGCAVGDEYLPGFTDPVTHPVLSSLDATANEISDAGVQSLVNSPLWPRLTHLVLDRNPIGDEGAFALADAPPTAIRFLNVRGTGIGLAGRQRLLGRKGWNVALF